MESSTAAAIAVKRALEAQFDLAPDEVIIAPGAEVSWDWTEECTGLQIVYVQVRQLAPIRLQTLADGTVCVQSWQAQIAAGALRCMAQGELETALAPEPGELSADALAILEDSTQLYAAIASLGWTGVWYPLGPQGALAGGEVLATVEVDQP